MKKIVSILFLLLFLVTACGTKPVSPPTAADVPEPAATAIPPTATFVPPTTTPLQPTEVPTATPTSSLPPIAFSTKPVDCLVGTNDRFNKVGVLYPDQNFPVTGQFNDPTTGLWYLIFLSGPQCYVPAKDVQLFGNTSNIPKVRPPNLPKQ